MKKNYTVLDLYSAFFLINLKLDDMEKLDFITEDSKYATVRLIFGSKISSTLFAELIETVLVDLNNDEVRYFVDDVILATHFLGRMISS